MFVLLWQWFVFFLHLFYCFGSSSGNLDAGTRALPTFQSFTTFGNSSLSSRGASGHANPGSKWLGIPPKLPESDWLRWSRNFKRVQLPSRTRKISYFFNHILRLTLSIGMGLACWYVLASTDQLPAWWSANLTWASIITASASKPHSSLTLGWATRTYKW